MGAGGTRGCAHAGVVQVLQQAEIPIDLVVGASVGAIFGLGVAAGLPVGRLTKLVEDATPADMFRFYAGRLTPFRSNPISRLLREAGEGKDFSDLDLPFAVVATDMATGQPVVIDRGPVLPAIQASIALPFVARPVAVGNNYYLDGGLMEVTPVRVAHEMGATHVIAVHLGHSINAPAFLRRPWTRSMLDRAGQARLPVRGKLADQVRFGLRLVGGAVSAPPSSQADIDIWPVIRGVNPSSFFGMQYCYRAGVDAARLVLPEIDRCIGDEATPPD